MESEALDTDIAVLGTEFKAVDSESDGINEDALSAEDTPQLDFCRRHLTTCIIVGATSMIVVTATVITCAVVIGYKISKETISFQYGTVVFKTTDNTSVIETISARGHGQTDISLPGEALITFDYQRFLMIIHFSKFDGICFVTQINDTWTKILSLRKGYKTVLKTKIPDVLRYLRTDAPVDRNFIPYTIQHSCRKHSYWMNKVDSTKGVAVHRPVKGCKPACLTFCFAPQTACIKVCILNPCINRAQKDTENSSTGTGKS